MKQLVTLFVFLTLFAGCFPSIPATYLQQDVIASKSAIAVYSKNGSGVGRKVSDMPVKVGDTLKAFAYASSGGTFYYLLFDGKDSVWVSNADVMDLCDHAASTQSSTFFVASSLDKIAWGRANFYVSKHSDWKIQTANDYMIDTYNPSGSGYGFTITKEPKENGFFYTVRCKSGYSYNIGYEDAKKKEKKAAYYILTGSCQY